MDTHEDRQERELRDTIANANTACSEPTSEHTDDREDSVAGGRAGERTPSPRGCFACMLGGAEGRTLFIAAAQWRGMDAAMRDGPGQTGQLLAAPGQAAAHAGHP